ncbi:minor tail protein [Arthrobacter phage Suppi]|uniref:Minor tail protein n=5 Tax=Korravirus TaxID=1982076 RepID=A0A1D8ESK3_9CAUD|nr:minor tail protein [Arthrobacter phage Wayne]YP_010050188.1 minor tail protein [Arthrobacter phage Litotes]AOT24047.1 minor tail protein [Arthrobacter phage Suppi]ASR83255.1 minor tail protein [Arthrobacter phage Canowicakte]AZF97655.1 minor tail protein [Arthrobacter phage CallieOMalley]QHB47189.1 minor tail protein [Arthrobacter phage AppleCider]ALY10744.2 minor tail protein [Arthrobacter phage Wayne]
MADNELTATSWSTLDLVTGDSVQWGPGAQLVMNDIEGWWGSSPIRRDKSDRLGAHGSHSERGWKDERLITIQGAYLGVSRDDAEAKAEELAGLFGDGTEGKFSTLTQSGRYRWANVYLTGDGFTPKWRGRAEFTFTIFLLATDPRKYGPVFATPETGIPTSGGGLFTEPLFGSPTPGVLDFGIPGSSGTVDATNTGTADTGPVFTIKGTYVPGFTITETNSGRRLVYTGTLRTGQTLVIDTNDGSVLLDGYAPRDLQTAQWTRLGRGEQGRWLFESPGSTGATMKVEVTPAWW